MTRVPEMVYVELEPDDATEVRAHLAAVEAAAAGKPRENELPPEVTRAARRKTDVLLDSAEDDFVPTRVGELGIRVLRADQPDGVYLHFHGGGWVFGSANGQDGVLDSFRKQANVTVVSVDYRLAPDHHYPASIEDAEDVAGWLLDNAETRFGTNRLVIAGESAGAHLAVLALLALRDQRGATGFLGANLSYGVFDLSMTPSLRLFGEESSVISTARLAWMMDSFLGADNRDRTDPSVSPLQARLEGMPPALFSVGTLDALLDDSLFMATRWAAAGSSCRVDLYDPAPHAFLRLPIQLGMLSCAREAAFVRGLLATG